MTDSKIFHTKSLWLRPIKKSDFESVFRWENNPDNWLQSGIYQPYEREEIMNYVSKTENLETDGQTRFMIELHSNEVIGCVDLCEYHGSEKLASVGLIIDPLYRNKGYGFEALTCLSVIAKSFFNLSMLKAKVLEENIASAKLFEKCGYVSDDTKASVYRYHDKAYIQFSYIKKL